MKKHPTSIVAAAAAALLLSAPATATMLTPAYDITEPGLSIAKGGAGLEDLHSGGTPSIDITVDGDVVQALLYWAGRDFPCAPSGAGCAMSGLDQDLVFDGVPISGTVVGEEVNFAGASGNTNNIGYVADVTDIVDAAGTGNLNFTIADGDAASNLFRLNGAGLIVLYTNPADSTSYNVTIHEGLDFAYFFASPAAATVTEPVTFDYSAGPTDRQGELIVFAGDAEGFRPDIITISDNTTRLDTLNADDGVSWDSDILTINVPANADSTTVQLISETHADNSNTPDSLLWAMTALRVPVAGSGRMTGGRNMRVDGTRITGGMTIHCDITLSNNIEINWPGGNKWHLDKPIETAICTDDPAISPLPPVAPFDTFAGTALGRLNGSENTSWLHFTFADAGEPGTSDYVKIQIWAPGDDPNIAIPVLDVEGLLTHGNIQAHYDQPHK